MASPEDGYLTDSLDSPAYMEYRRIVNEEYAEVRVDFNLEGLNAGQLVLQREFTSSDTVLDIGSSTGKAIARAAIDLNTPVSIVCVDPAEEAFTTYINLTRTAQSRVSFIRAGGEHLPIADGSMIGASMHNVIFRARDAAAMLTEAKRVVMPGGFIVISTNAEGHAQYRHELERAIAERLIAESGVRVDIPKPPAAGHYLQDVKDLISLVEGLEILDELFVYQDTKAIITPGDRVFHFVRSIDYTAANVNLENNDRRKWRSAAESIIVPFVTDRIEQSRQQLEKSGEDGEPYFADTIKRGMIVIRKAK